MRLSTLLVAALLLVPSAASADEADDLRARMEAVAPSVAVVKCVLLMKWTQDGAPGERETKMEGRAATVDPTGILVLHGAAVGADTEEQREWRQENPTAQMKTSAEDIRVIFPPDATEHPAAVLLLDSRLELAFLQVLDLGEKRLPAVDLTRAATPRLGQTLAGITRDQEGYGYAPSVRTLYASGRLEKPAAMWLAAGDFDQVGLPVFTLDGKACGILSQQSAVEGAGDDEDGETTRNVILPLEAVLKSLDAARKKIPEVLARVAAERKASAEDAKKPAEPAPAEGPAKLPPPKEPPPEPAKPKEPPSPAEALLAGVAPAIVEIRFTAAISFSMMGQSGEQEVSSEAFGTVVDPSGLVLTSDSLTAGARSPIVAMVESVFPGIELKIDLKELRVVPSEGAEELRAVLVARDGRNDLAWVQVVDLGERRLPALDLAASRDPRVGEALATIGRLGRGFGYAPTYAKGRVMSANDRPRRHWALTSDADDVGLFTFAPAGTPLGVLIFLSAAEGTGGTIPETRLLPMDVVKKSLENARARVPEVLEKARGK